MWREIKDIANTASAMLQSGKAPPNTPDVYVDELKATNFLRSKKFFITFSSILIVLAFFGISVFILFLTAPIPTLTISFVSIFVETLKVLTIIIAAYLGLQTVLDFKYNSNSNIDLIGENSTISETVNETVDEKIIQEFSQKYEGDPSYAPLTWINQNV
jgi:hypothetical protein